MSDHINNSKPSIEESFIDDIITLRNYWINESRATTKEDVLDGFIHSLFVMIDGDSSVNDFHYLKVTDTVAHKVLNPKWLLHELYFPKLKEYPEDVKKND